MGTDQTKKLETIATYNSNAKEMAKKFDSLGARTKDIEEVFALFATQNPKTVEIGCGNGRDAEVILQHTDDYLGFDISEELVALAKLKVPAARFEVADAVSFNYPENTDILLAFASIIHLDKEDMAIVLEKAFNSLSPFGIFRISLKHTHEYEEVTQTDVFGTRTYYFYSESDMVELCKDFSIVKSGVRKAVGQDWLELILQKK